MINWIKKLFNNNDQTVAQQADQIKQLQQQTEQLQQLLEKKTVSSKGGPTDENVPWVNLKSAEYDPATGFRIDLDWNDAFIKQLKDNGIDGPNEDVIIQKWLAFLYEDVVKKLGSKQELDKEEKNIVSDYE